MEILVLSHFSYVEIINVLKVTLNFFLFFYLEPNSLFALPILYDFRFYITNKEF